MNYRTLTTNAALVIALIFTVGLTSTAIGNDSPTPIEARKAHTTKWRESAYEREKPLPAPPAGTYELIRYPSPAGKLAALITPAPKDGRKRPAVVWLHGGFGGLDPSYWQAQQPTNDQTPKAFVDAGFVVMLPSFRGENDNPGRFELFAGEVDDALAAVDHVRSLPHVDASRVYLLGHSSGATIALLAAMSTTTDRVRACVAFGGVWNCAELGESWGPIFPFDPADQAELKLRSPAEFVGALKVPTWDIEGALGNESSDMAELSRKSGGALRVVRVADANHFDVLRPCTRVVAQQLMADAGAKPDIKITAEQLDKAFQQEFADRLAKRRAAPILELTPAAVDVVKQTLQRGKLDPDRTWIMVSDNGVNVQDKLPPGHVELRQAGLRIALAKAFAAQVEKAGKIRLDYNTDPADRGFVFKPREDE